MPGEVAVAQHPTGALCLIMESAESGVYECSETYFLPPGVRFEDVAVTPEHPNTVQRHLPLPQGMTAAALFAMADEVADKIREGLDQA